tara:strand:- start:2940 stop:3791 length:852 start_codon:yes stop_codon:yes gene_type:complete
MAPVENLSWSVEQRLEFIEFRLFWHGGVNRSDIASEFGVSVPQASKDLSRYQAIMPRNVRYDASEKRYIATEQFAPRFISLDPEAFLLGQVRAHDALAGPIHSEVCPLPRRSVDVDTLRKIVAAASGESAIEICYQSMSAQKPELEWRWISPHAFGSDGLRWHVRAFCHQDQKFKDFLLSRCTDARGRADAGARSSDDQNWNHMFEVELEPNPRLSTAQKAAVATDFCMLENCARVQVRKAMLYHFLRRMRLDAVDSLDGPQQAPVVIRNRAAFDTALSEALA